MTAPQFVKLWAGAAATERAGAQSHFTSLCRLQEVVAPDDDPEMIGSHCFERGLEKTAGGDGWADAWLNGHFGWEYKGS